MEISSLSASRLQIKPKVGETATISGSITSNYPITWTLFIADRVISGSGKNASYNWNGKKENGEPVPAGVYTATLTASSGECETSASATITVVDPPDSCKLKAPFGSSVDVASGNLSFTQDVFTTKGVRIPISFSLSYNSLDSSEGSLGPYWRHNYDIILEPAVDGSRVLNEGGDRRLYTWNGTSYDAQAGDSSTLVRNADESHDLSYPDGRICHFDPDGKIVTIADRFNNSLTFNYTDGDLTSVTDSAHRAAILDYDTTVTPHRLTHITDPALHRFDFIYQDGRLWKVVNPATDAGVDPGYWEYTYFTSGGKSGLLQSKADPERNVTVYDYYADRRAMSALDPNGKTRSMIYPSTTDNLRTSTFMEKDQSEWRYIYDVQIGVLKEKVDPLLKSTSFYHYPYASLKAKTEPFDGTTRLTTFYAYDSHGNMVFTTDPLDLSLPQYTGIDPETVDTTTFETVVSPIRWAEKYQYDFASHDRITESTDLRGDVPLTTTYNYGTENGGDVVTVTAPGNVVTITKYNPDGTIRELTDANSKTTTFSYYPDTPDNRTAGIVGLLQQVK